MTGTSIAGAPVGDTGTDDEAPPRSGDAVRRVAALIDTFEVSGPGRQLVALGQTLARHGVALHVVMLQRAGRPAPPFAEFVRRSGLDCTVLPDRGPLDVGILRRVAQLLRELRPDVVQTHSYRMTTVLAGLRAAGLRMPWLGFFHGATAEDRKVRVYHALDRSLLGRADAIVVMSARQADEFARRGRAPIHVIHNAVIPMQAAGDFALPEPIETRRRTLGAPVVGVVGRLSHEKGVDLFLDAIARLRDEATEVSAIVAGDGPDAAALRGRVDAHRLQDRVSLVGAVRDVRALYATLDLLVIPSRSEGLPNVLLEALAADLPVVSTNVGAVPEVLTDPRAGIVVPADDVPALARAIVAALAMRGDPESAEARALTAARFSLDARTLAIRRLYSQITRGRAAGR